MKLRNKKTGEIADFNPFLERWNGPTRERIYYSSLSKLNEMWKDYEEQQEYWFINWDGDVENETDDDTEVDNSCKVIGNYFETREEAEKAVEKLKAWTRLKEKGFRFVGITETSPDMGCVEFEIGKDFYKEQSIRDSELNKDLDLLFGGEE